MGPKNSGWPRIFEGGARVLHSILGSCIPRIGWGIVEFLILIRMMGGGDLGIIKTANAHGAESHSQSKELFYFNIFLYYYFMILY